MSTKRILLGSVGQSDPTRWYGYGPIWLKLVVHYWFVIIGPRDGTCNILQIRIYATLFQSLHKSKKRRRRRMKMKIVVVVVVVVVALLVAAAVFDVVGICLL